MSKYFIYIIYFWCFFSYFKNIAQNIILEIPPSYDSEHWGMLNTAQQGVYSKNELAFNHTSYTGLKKIINQNYLNTFFTFKKHSKNTSGFQFTNNQLGPYININLFSFSHTYFIIKEPDYQLSTSLYLGGINYFIESDGITAGGSDWVADGGASVWWKYKKIAIGGSVHHLFNGILSPLQEKITLEKKYHFIGKYQLNIGQNMIYEPTLLVQKQGINTSFYWCNQLVVYKHFSTTIGLLNNQGLSLGAGLKNIEIKNNHQISLFMNYFSKIKTQNAFSNRYELTFILSKKENKGYFLEEK